MDDLVYQELIYPNHYQNLATILSQTEWPAEALDKIFKELISVAYIYLDQDTSFKKCIQTLVKKGIDVNITACTPATIGFVCEALYLERYEPNSGNLYSPALRNHILDNQLIKCRSLKYFFEKLFVDKNSQITTNHIQIEPIIDTNWCDMVDFLEWVHPNIKLLFHTKNIKTKYIKFLCKRGHCKFLSQILNSDSYKISQETLSNGWAEGYVGSVSIEVTKVILESSYVNEINSFTIDWILSEACKDERTEIFDLVLSKVKFSFGVSKLVFHDDSLDMDCYSDEEFEVPEINGKQITPDDMLVRAKYEIPIYNFLSDRLFHRLWLMKQVCPIDLIADVLHYICGFYLRLLIN